MNTDISIDSVDLWAVDFHMSDYNMNYSTSDDDNKNLILINERNTMLPLYISGKYSNNEFEQVEIDDDDEPWVHCTENKEQKVSSREEYTTCTHHDNNDVYTFLLGLCHHYSENNIIDDYISSSIGCIYPQIEDDLPEPTVPSSINEELRINGSSLLVDREDDVMGIVIEIKEEEDNDDIDGLATHHTVVTNRWDEEEIQCGYDHENEHNHNHNHYASKSTTRRRIVSEKMDPTLSYLVGSSSSNTANPTNIEETDEDSTWGYYDHASLSEQSIATPSVCECD
eukprot:CAMPEP_0171035296 /NCGR_PEP_ID=MMETSP0736-20130129/40534_1 /TAXON_ID=186038 /ORGANISM="Fragilariopsis kerguelensis, Strain L26-C5" /LENGTH=282 /DNA_ID=CAMNT_0011479477 /DNA_START=93 /DNA_END=938 /DNA_ORIENTATION=+